MAVYDADRTWWLLGSIFILIFPIDLFLTWHPPSSFQIPPVRSQVRPAIESAGHHTAGVESYRGLHRTALSQPGGEGGSKPIIQPTYYVQKCQYCEQEKCIHQSPIFIFF